MNNFPQISDIILQIFVAFLTLMTSLITAYIALKLGQKESKIKTKLGIIKAATSDVRMYSQQIKSTGESKDLLEFIIRILPIKVIELETDLKKLEVIKHKIITKGKFLIVIPILILVFQIYYFFISNLRPIPDLIAIIIFSFASIGIIIASARISMPFLKGIQDTDKKLKQIKGVFEKAKGANLINLRRRENLTEFIKQRYQEGFGVSLKNITEELELYGLKIPDSEILRAHFDFFYADDPEIRRSILATFYLDGETHESFDELSDEEIINFLETVKSNLTNEPALIRSFLKLQYADPEKRKEVLTIFFMDEKPHESFDELSDDQILNFIKTTQRNLESLRTQEDS